MTEKAVRLDPTSIGRKEPGISLIDRALPYVDILIPILALTNIDDDAHQDLQKVRINFPKKNLRHAAMRYKIQDTKELEEYLKVVIATNGEHNHRIRILGELSVPAHSLNMDYFISDKYNEKLIYTAVLSRLEKGRIRSAEGLCLLFARQKWVEYDRFEKQALQSAQHDQTERSDYSSHYGDPDNWDQMMMESMLYLHWASVLARDDVSK